MREGWLGRSSSERVWAAGAPKELAFWERRLRDPEIETAWAQYLPRMDPASPVEDPVASLIAGLPDESVALLDVGAGPLTVLGKTHPEKTLRITATDPLAEDYARIMGEVGIEPPVPTIDCRGEDLLERFDPGSFDVAFSQNALDHSVDPVRVVSNMVELVKEGRFVVLRHRRREGRSENYWGLHQWNFDCEAGEFLLWRGRRERVSMNRVLGSVATVECSLEDGWVICLITKRRR